MSQAHTDECGSPSRDYYDDRHGERGNLWAATLHYPGRPHYRRTEGEANAPGKRERYYHACGKWSERDAVSEREETYGRMLRDDPGDVQLWLQYIHFLEEHGPEGAALAAAERAEERTEGAAREVLRAARLRVASYTMQHHQYTDLLKRLSNEEVDIGVLGHAILAADTVTGATTAAVAAFARARDTTRHMHLLYVYGGFLRVAGLYERLVLLLELMLAMNCPPPPRPSPRSRDVGDADGATPTLLPMSALWPRAERKRAAEAWRPRPMSAAFGDPQSCPAPADVAPLLRPARSVFLLLLTTLRLIKVPLSPHTDYLLTALHGHHADLAQIADHDSACLLPLLEARPVASNAVDAAAVCARWTSPPHYLHDEHGYLSWVEWIWECGCHWTEGEEREALLCWRTRWHSALLRQAEGRSRSYEEESRRVRRRLKTALKSWGTPLAFAEYSRLLTDKEEGTRACLAALGGSLTDATRERSLYISRIIFENHGPEAPSGVWATCCAALGLELPEDDRLSRPPPRELRTRALAECRRRCDDFEERAPAAFDVEKHAHRLLLPAEGEWPRARARLADEERLRALCETDRPRGALEPPEPSRWREENTEGLVIAARRYRGLSAAHARRMRHAYPHNAVLAYEAGRAPLWRMACRSWPVAGGTLPALGELLPALCRAENEGWSSAAARRVVRMARRLVSRGAGSPLLWSMLVAAEAAAGDARGALSRGVLCRPQHKWLYVAGAEYGALPAMEAADLLLERELRVHVLPQELEQQLQIDGAVINK